MENRFGNYHLQLHQHNGFYLNQNDGNDLNNITFIICHFTRLLYQDDITETDCQNYDHFEMTKHKVEACLGNGRIVQAKYRYPLYSVNMFTLFLILCHVLLRERNRDKQTSGSER